MHLVTIAKCDSEFHANLVVNLLEDKGIRTHIAGGMASLAGVGAGIPCGAVVQVADGDVRMAYEFLKEIAERRANAPAARNNWPNTVGKVGIWFALALPFIIALFYLVQWMLDWMLGWN